MTRVPTADLLPCPFCNAEAPDVHLSPITGVVFCEGCGAEGPWSPFFDGDWNTRTLPAASPVDHSTPAPSSDAFLPSTDGICTTEAGAGEAVEAPAHAEPVAYLHSSDDGSLELVLASRVNSDTSRRRIELGWKSAPLYAHPPTDAGKPPSPLPDAELDALMEAINSLPRSVMDCGTAWVRLEQVHSALRSRPVGDRRTLTVFDWAYTNADGLQTYARTPEVAEQLIAEGIKLTPVYVIEPPALTPTTAQEVVNNPSQHKHDWVIWPETDGQEQKCLGCGGYRKTPPANNSEGAK